MLPETVGRLSKIANIIGVKEATGKLERLQQIRDLCGENFAIYTGDDASSCEFCLLGGNGSITVTGNVAPKNMHDMLAAALRGDRETARALDASLAALHSSLFIQSNPIPVKWAVAEMGLMGKGIRLPLTWLTEDCYATVRTPCGRLVFCPHDSQHRHRPVNPYSACHAGSSRVRLYQKSIPGQGKGLPISYGNTGTDRPGRY